MTAEKVPTYLLAYYGVSALRHAFMQQGYYCIRHVTVHTLLYYRGCYIRKRSGHGGKVLRLLDGSCRERSLSYGMVRFTIERSFLTS